MLGHDGAYNVKRQVKLAVALLIEVVAHGAAVRRRAIVAIVADAVVDSFDVRPRERLLRELHEDEEALALAGVVSGCLHRGCVGAWVRRCEITAGDIGSGTPLGSLRLALLQLCRREQTHGAIGLSVVALAIAGFEPMSVFVAREHQLHLRAVGQRAGLPALFGRHSHCDGAA